MYRDGGPAAQLATRAQSGISFFIQSIRNPISKQHAGETSSSDMVEQAPGRKVLGLGEYEITQCTPYPCSNEPRTRSCLMRQTDGSSDGTRCYVGGGQLS